MQAKIRILLLIGLLFIIGTVAADPLTLSISSSETWITANGVDTAAINVHVTNTSTGAVVQGATLNFTVDNPVYGNIQGSTLSTTGPDGDGSGTFAASTKSGVAVIRVNAQYLDNGNLLTTVGTINQNINHDAVQNAVYSYAPQATVGTITHLNITLTDRWGNPIDDKNPGDNHQVFLDMNTDGGAGFQPGNAGRTGPLPIDNNGNVSVDLRVSTTAELNIFQMEPVGNLLFNNPQFISGLADQNPASLTQTIPSPNALPADGAPADAFGIFYTVYDKYGNPINNTQVTTVASDTNIPYTSTTNSYGMVFVSFGPKDIIGYYTLNASANGNTSAVCQYPATVGPCSQVVQFYNTAPVDLSLAANPLAMTSLDVDPTANSIIQAKVTDIKGNPVTGELVRFSLGTTTYPGGPYFNISSGPTISAQTANVSGGAATITFKPGAFAGYTDPGYNGTSTGQVVLTASWQNNQTSAIINRTVTLVWKNYPYLSTLASAACTNVQVGDNINLTIQLVGNGAALRPKPIDAELIMDVSGSMGQTPKMNGPLGSQYKIVYSNSSGQAFVTQMDPTKDQVGLVTFGQSASVPYHLGNNFASVKTAISQMSASGNTNTRTALKMAIEDVIARKNPNPKSIQAIILLTDGAYNYDGDPLARKSSYKETSEGEYGTNVDGTMYWYNFSTLSVAEQNLAYYAKEHNIRIYPITFGVDDEIQPGYANVSGTWQIYNTFDLMASQTGGTHYAAADGSQLLDVYTAIAGNLSQTAGGNTQVALNFGQINLNDALASNVTDYMAYVPDLHLPARTTDSTFVDKVNQTPAGTVYQLYNYSRDDTNNWTNKMLNFNVGTINLNETWSTTFRLNLTQAGKIELFPASYPSYLTFTDTSTGLTTNSPLPPIQCNVEQGYVDQGYGGLFLSVNNLSLVGSNPNPNIWTIQWNTTYTGNLTAQELIQYRPDGNGPWTTLGMDFKTKTAQSTDQYTIDTSSWVQNADYDIQIQATASDADYSNVIITATKNGPTATNYIKLE